MTAPLAFVVAEVADVRRVEDVGRAATHAVGRVGRVLRPASAGVARVVDPEDDRVGPLRDQGSELRVVTVDDEHRVGREVVDQRAPALGDQLQLPVAVELVAEEVPEAEDARVHERGHLRERRLVHLEQAELGAVRRQERRRDPGDEVRAGTVVGEPHAPAEDLRRHRCRRRFAVRRRERGRAPRQTPREARDRRGVELPEELARQRRPAPGTGEPGERTRGARGRRKRGEGEMDPHRAVEGNGSLERGIRAGRPPAGGGSITCPGIRCGAERRRGAVSQCGNDERNAYFTCGTNDLRTQARLARVRCGARALAASPVVARSGEGVDAAASRCSHSPSAWSSRRQASPAREHAGSWFRAT